MSIIKHVTLQKIVAHDFRYDPRILADEPENCTTGGRNSREDHRLINISRMDLNNLHAECRKQKNEGMATQKPSRKLRKRELAVAINRTPFQTQARAGRNECVITSSQHL